MAGVLLLGLISTASGYTITWTGNVSSNWADTNNWSPNEIPYTNAHNPVTITTSTPHPCVVDGTTQCAWKCTFSGSGTMTIRPGGMLITSNNVTINSYGEVQSNATLAPGADYLGISFGTPGVSATLDVNGGTVDGAFAPGTNMFGVGSIAPGYGNTPGTGILNVALGDYVRCPRVLLATSGRGIINITNEGSRFEWTGEFRNGIGGGIGAVNVYNGTLAGNIFYNAYDYSSTGILNICGGQLLVTSDLYNSYIVTNTSEQVTITIASGATNLWVGGNYYQRTNSAMIVELTATSHPPLRVNGIAYLAGTLRVASNSVEQLTSVEIIIGDADTNSGTAGLSGRFNTFDASAMPHPANWSLSYTDDKVTLSYSPRGTLVKCH